MALIFLASTAAATAGPHLVQLVIDDLGFADTSVHDKPEQPADIPTPHLRSMADEGVRLSRLYVQPVCSPTRSALLSGRYPFRDGMQHETTITPGSLAHLPLQTPTAAELLGAKGYNCHAIGKWHLGYASWKYTPLQRGFQSFTGYFQGQVDYFNKTIAIGRRHGFSITGFDFWHGMRAGRRSSEFPDAMGKYSLDQYRMALQEVLAPYAADEPAPGPLYLYLAMQTVHLPLESRLAEGDTRCLLIQDHWRSVYCSMLVEMDDAVGELLASLKTASLWENSLVVVTSDNGGMTRWAVRDAQGDPAWPASAGDNFPFRGSKATLFEGGVRAIGFFSGGHVPHAARGSTFDGLTHAVDLTATLLGRGGCAACTDGR